MFPLFHTPKKNLPQVHKDDLMTVSFLDKGTFGEVHFGCLKGEPVAIKKLINKSHAEKEAEINLHASLSHPNIISALARYDSPDKDVYLVLEFMNSKDLLYSLSHSEQKTMLSLRMRLSIIRSMIDALTYLHETMHILHRDIKPENILLNHHMEAKLCDFGLSSTIENSKYLPSSGTTYYIAPELLESRRFHNTQTTDNYALGVTIFVLMTICSPKGIHKIDIIKEIMLQVNAVPQDIAKALKNLILNSTATNPSHRMSLSDMSKLTDAITRLLNTTQPLVLASDTNPLTSILIPDDIRFSTELNSEVISEVVEAREQPEEKEEKNDCICVMS
ncbi:MAG: serine/threonine-protein kinase [Legionellaceae bacterium]|nr:serine/threonine-protein kinase [Legionellaceae bacterium]